MTYIYSNDTDIRDAGISHRKKIPGPRSQVLLEDQFKETSHGLLSARQFKGLYP